MPMSAKTTFDLMFTTEEERLLWSIFFIEAPMVTGTNKHWCCERPAGWRELLCWNWGGTLTTDASICSNCYSTDKVERRRLNTMYHNEESNWLTSCEVCYDEAYEHFADQWREYYQGRL